MEFLSQIFTSLDYWVFIGFAGQFVFFARFIVQWIYAERKKESVIPISFWYLSIAGALIILVYAIHRQDIVFIAGQGIALLIYTRNLQLQRRTQNRFPPVSAE